MLLRLLLLFTLFSPLLSNADELDDWMGAGLSSNSIGVRWGEFSEEGNLAGVMGVLTMPYYSEFSFSYTQSSGPNKDKFDHTLLSISSDPYSTWSGEIQYQYAGSEKILESEIFAIAVKYLYNAWRFQVAYSAAEIDSYAATQWWLDDRPRTHLATIDREGLEFGIDYYADLWGFSVSAENYDYNRSLESIENRPYLQFVLGEQSLSKLYAMTDWLVDANVYYQWRDTTVSLGLTRHRAVVDGRLDNNFYLILDQLLTANIGASFLIANSTADSLTYSELALNYYW